MHTITPKLVDSHVASASRKEEEKNKCFVNKPSFSLSFVFHLPEREKESNVRLPAAGSIGKTMRQYVIRMTSHSLYPGGKCDDLREIS